MSFCDEDEGIPPLCADFSPSPTTPISPFLKPIYQSQFLIA